VASSERRPSYRDRFDQYALRAFDVHALDYLLKPFTDDGQAVPGARQAAGVSRPSGGLSQKLAAPWATEEPVAGRSRAVPRPSAGQVGGTVTLLPGGEIEWIDAQEGTTAHPVGKSWHLLRETMKNLEGQLDATRSSGSTVDHREPRERSRSSSLLPRGSTVVVLPQSKTTLKLSRATR